MLQPPLSLRPALPEDRNALESFFHQVIQQAFDDDGILHCCADEIPREVEYQMNILDAHLNPADTTTECFVLLFESSPIATVAFGPLNPEITKPLPQLPTQSPEIKSVYVHPAHRQRGYGHFVFNHILQRLAQLNVDTAYLAGGYSASQPYWYRLLGEPFHVVRDRWAPGAHYVIWEVRPSQVLSQLPTRPLLHSIPADNSLSVCRVLAVHRSAYTLEYQNRRYTAEIGGRSFFLADSPLDLPLTGDRVLALLQADDLSIIEEVLPRSSVLKRKVVGRKSGVQGIAANVDEILIVMGLDENYNPNRLDRFATLATDSGADFSVILTKADKLSPEEKKTKTDHIRSNYPGHPVYSLDARSEKDVSSLASMLRHNRTYCFLGSSGVGKSTILNTLAGREIQLTADTREFDGKGRHATTRRELIRLEQGFSIIDTPGMRELGNQDITEAINENFDQFTQLSAQCRFSDCSHQHEAGCAILNALENGDFTSQRYESYLKLLREEAHHQRTNYEQRRRDRSFGKMVKEVKKHKKLTKPK